MTGFQSRLAVILIPIISLYAGHEVRADDVQNFTIAPTAPPTPALKFKLMFDSTELQPGNAAVYYMQAMMFGNDNLYKEVQEAMDAVQGGNDAAFKRIMSS